MLESEVARLGWTMAPNRQTATRQYGDVVQLRPFPGVIGMPPAEVGIHSTIPPRGCDGNLDCREWVPGSRLFLPISVSGAMLSVGDGHAMQGDGEVAGVAIECPMETEVELHLHTDRPLQTPRAETPAGRLTLGLGSNLDEATTAALDAMVDWICELHPMPRGRALAFASLAVDLRITQIVNQTVGVRALWQEDRWTPADRS